MPPDLGSLRLRALAVPGVSRLADHHDGLGPPPRPSSHGALRVFDRHVEIDVFLADDHAATTTSTALRAALAPLLTGQDVRVTVIDVDTNDPQPASPDTGAAEPRRGARAVACVAHAHLESLTAEGLPVADRPTVTRICRILIAYDVDPVSRRVLVSRLRAHLSTAHGPTGRRLVDRLDAVDDTEEAP